MKLYPLIITLLLISSAFISCKKEKITANPKALALKLEAIAKEDQKYRQHQGEIKERHGKNSVEMKELLRNQSKVDSANVKTVVEIIKELGAYPGKSLVGIEASKTAFYVLYHAPLELRKNYLDLILEASANNELSKTNGARFHDRCLMDQGLPQIYGTQMKSETITNSRGATYDTTYLWNIKDTINIDQLRRNNGLVPLEKFLSGYGKSRWN